MKQTYPSADALQLTYGFINHIHPSLLLLELLLLLLLVKMGAN